MTLSSTLKASRNSLICHCGFPVVVVVVVVVGVSSLVSTISGYMASLLAVGAFGTTWSIMVEVAFKAQRFGSSLLRLHNIRRRTFLDMFMHERHCNLLIISDVEVARISAHVAAENARATAIITGDDDGPIGAYAASFAARADAARAAAARAATAVEAAAADDDAD
nr:hypothetical protein [Tanacetum cinerariifolium]